MDIIFIMGQVVDALSHQALPNRLVGIHTIFSAGGHRGGWGAVNCPHSRNITAITGRRGEFLLPISIDATPDDWGGGNFTLNVWENNLGTGPVRSFRGTFQLTTDLVRLLRSVGIICDFDQSHGPLIREIYRRSGQATPARGASAPPGARRISVPVGPFYPYTAYGAVQIHLPR
jgi:hypothetical protein